MEQRRGTDVAQFAELIAVNKQLSTLLERVSHLQHEVADNSRIINSIEQKQEEACAALQNEVIKLKVRTDDYEESSKIIQSFIADYTRMKQRGIGMITVIGFMLVGLWEGAKLLMDK
jgi:uncharacterized protein YlxW (UPF0749 family)